MNLKWLQWLDLDVIWIYYWFQWNICALAAGGFNINVPHTHGKQILSHVDQCFYFSYGSEYSLCARQSAQCASVYLDQARSRRLRGTNIILNDIIDFQMHGPGVTANPQSQEFVRHNIWKVSVYSRQLNPVVFLQWHLSALLSQRIFPF